MRWKKWLVSGMRTSCGGCAIASTQANTACGSTTSSASPWITSHGQVGSMSVLKSQLRSTGGAIDSMKDGCSVAAARNAT